MEKKVYIVRSTYNPEMDTEVLTNKDDAEKYAERRSDTRNKMIITERVINSERAKKIITGTNKHYVVSYWNGKYRVLTNQYTDRELMEPPVIADPKVFIYDIEMVVPDSVSIDEVIEKAKAVVKK